MQQDILIIGVLFPAIPLMMINFGNRYIVLANLIRTLHDTGCALTPPQMRTVFASDHCITKPIAANRHDSNDVGQCVYYGAARHGNHLYGHGHPRQLDVHHLPCFDGIGHGDLYAGNSFG